jgi:hypothetical protein
MTKLAVFVFFDILGVGCLATVILLGGSLPQMTFIGLVGGACVASLGIGLLSAVTAIQSSQRKKQLCIRPPEPQAYDYVRYSQQLR